MSEVWKKIEAGLNNNELIIFSNSMMAQEEAAAAGGGEEIKKVYSYALVGTTDYKGTRIMQVRDPLDTQIFKKGWIQNANLFNDEAMDVNTKIQEEEDILYIPFVDIFRLFDTAIVSKLLNWEDMRIRGRFERFTDTNDPKFQILISKWYYTIEVDYTTDQYIYLHQEPENKHFVYDYRPYLSVGLMIYSIDEDGELEFKQSTEFIADSRISIFMKLKPGKYVVVPVTACPTLHGSEDARDEDDPEIIETTNKFTAKMIDCLEEMFKRYQINMSGYLNYFEFNNVTENLDLSFTEAQYRDRIIPEYGIKGKGVTLNGFSKFFLHLFNECGHEAFSMYMERYGYDECLINTHYRNIVISFHSRERVRITRRDSVTEKMFMKPLIHYAQLYGTIAESKFPKYGGVSLVKFVAPHTMSFIYILTNRTDRGVKVTFDLSGVSNAFKSHPNRKIIVQPDQTEVIALFEEDRFDENEIVMMEEWDIELVEENLYTLATSLNSLFKAGQFAAKLNSGRKSKNKESSEV